MKVCAPVPMLKTFSSLFAALTNLFFAEPTRFDVFVTGERIDFVWQNDSRSPKVRVIWVNIRVAAFWNRVSVNARFRVTDRRFRVRVRVRVGVR